MPVWKVSRMYSPRGQSLACYIWQLLRRQDGRYTASGDKELRTTISMIMLVFIWLGHRRGAKEEGLV